MVKLQEATSKFDSKLYEHSYRDLSHQYQATRVCGSEHTVAQSRCLQELLIKAEKKESDIQTKAGSMAAQGVVYGRIDRNNDKEVEGLGYGIDKEIQRLVTDAQNAAAKLDPDYAKNTGRIYSPAANNSKAVGTYLDLQEHPRSYREAFCQGKHSFATTAVCNVMRTALADELE